MSDRRWQLEIERPAPEGERVEVFGRGWSSIAQGVLVYERGQYRWRVWFGSEVTGMWPDYWRPLPPKPTDEELPDSLDATAAADPARCEVCGWTLAKSADEGCVPGNCSYRPDEGSAEYYRVQQRRDALAAPVAGRGEGRGTNG